MNGLVEFGELVFVLCQRYSSFLKLLGLGVLAFEGFLFLGFTG